MDDLERTFREGLRDAAAKKPPLDPIDLDEVTTRPVDDVPRRPARWLAVAAAVVLVAGIGAGAWALNSRGAGVPAIPAAPTTSPTSGQSSKPTSSPAPTSVTSLPPDMNCQLTSPGEVLNTNQVSVRALSTGQVGGLAKLTAMYLRSNGFHVSSYSEGSHARTGTTIRGTAADSPEVTLVQHFFPGAVAEGDGRADHSVDVLVDTEAGDVYDPHASVPVSGVLCLPSIPVKGVQVRIRNGSAQTFDSVVVVLPDGTREDYGKLAAGAASHYSDTTQAYGYASVTVVTAGRTLTVEPADYDRPLQMKAGQYTYELGVDRDGLTVVFLEKR
jgi:hypothetical protein